MGKGVSYFLFGMMVFLTVGHGRDCGRGRARAISEDRDGDARRVVLVFALWRGSVWWGDDAATYSQKLYKPLGISAHRSEPRDHMDLRITDPGWLHLRKLDDLVPDHGHLMHLFLVRWPEMDRVYHLHPDQTAAGFSLLRCRTVPAGVYRIYGDIVHDSGFAETAVGEARLPDIHGQPFRPTMRQGPIPATMALDGLAATKPEANRRHAAQSLLL